MEICQYCMRTMSTMEESANHPNVCYKARKAVDNAMQSDLTKAIEQMTKVLQKIAKKL